MSKQTDQTLTVDIAVIGGGSGGLSVAAGAAQMGASTVLIEKAKMGGDCLNTGCVPSKALIAAGHAAETVRTSAEFGVNGHEPEIDFGRVNAHVHDVIAGIAPHDSVERFEGLGVKVIEAAAKIRRQARAGGRRHPDQGPAHRRRHRLLGLRAADPRHRGPCPTSPMKTSSS